MIKNYDFHNGLRNIEKCLELFKNVLSSNFKSTRVNFIPKISFADLGGDTKNVSLFFSFSYGLGTP